MASPDCALRINASRSFPKLLLSNGFGHVKTSLSSSLKVRKSPFLSSSVCPLQLNKVFLLATSDLNFSQTEYYKWRVACPEFLESMHILEWHFTWGTCMLWYLLYLLIDDGLNIDHFFEVGQLHKKNFQKILSNKYYTYMWWR